MPIFGVSILDDRPEFETDVFLVDEIHTEFPNLNPWISSKSADFIKNLPMSLNAVKTWNSDQRPLA